MDKLTAMTRSGELENWANVLKKATPVQGVVFRSDVSTSLTDLARDTGKPDWVVRFQGFFSAARVIAHHGELTYLTAVAPGPTSPVFVAHQDEWSVLSPAGGSMSAWMKSLAAGRDPRGRGRRLDPALDPIKLLPRTRWLVRAFLEIDAESREEALEEAPSLRTWEREKARVGQWPHLAAYWMLAHAFFGQPEAFADASKRCRGLKHGIVREARVVAAALAADRKPAGRWARLLREKKAFLQEAAPRPTDKQELDVERATLEELRRTANSQRIREAIRLFDAADAAGDDLKKFKRLTGMDGPAVVKRICRLIDSRFGPFIRARLRRQVVQQTGSSVVLFLRRVLPDFASFCKELDSIGLRRLTRDQLSVVEDLCKQEGSSQAKIFGAKALDWYWKKI